MMFFDNKNGVIIDEETFNEEIARCKLHVKKYKKYWSELGFEYVLISMKDKTSGILDIKGFASKTELDIYTAGKIANIVYL